MNNNNSNKENKSISFHSGNATKEDLRSKIYERRVSSEKVSSGVPRGIFTIIICVLLIAMLIRKLTGNNAVPTFTSFLEFLSLVDVPTIPFINFSSVSLGDWGFFNFLRDFFNIFVDLGNVVLFLINGMWSVINYIMVLFRWLFV